MTLTDFISVVSLIFAVLSFCLTFDSYLESKKEK